MKIIQIALPKWPALIVSGKPVTKDQAKEIIIRTSGFHFFSNDREFETEINNLIYNVRCPGYDLIEALKKKLAKESTEVSLNEVFNYENEIKLKHGVMDLQYLDNRQVLSCWIGGPHGWCNWNGAIFANNYNIGKWPSVTEVKEDWEKIAKAFPYLDLICQLLDKETCEENPSPLVEFIIKGGKIKLRKPKKILVYPNDVDFLHWNNPHRERGCTIEDFKDALEYTRKQMKLDSISV